MPNTLIYARDQQETPEGIRLQLTLAHPILRGLAFAADLIILAVSSSIITGILLSVVGGQLAVGLSAIVGFLAWWGYFVLFEYWLQSSPGKRMFDLYVVSETGVPPSLAQSILRNVLRTADMLPAVFGFGLIAVIFHPKNMRLGDMVAGTLVIHRETTAKLKIPAVPPLPLPLTLTAHEQRSIALFAEYTSVEGREARAEELASILSPVFDEPSRPQLVSKLRSYAAWIAGQ